MGARPGLGAFVIYVVAFVVGAIVMSFEMLGSRYLNPYFGSGIYTWASLISTVLASLTVGYFLGGWLADRRPSAPVLGVTVLIGSLYILCLPLFAQPMLEVVLERIDDDAHCDERHTGTRRGARDGGGFHVDGDRTSGTCGRALRIGRLDHRGSRQQVARRQLELVGEHGERRVPALVDRERARRRGKNTAWHEHCAGRDARVERTGKPP